MEAYAGIHFVRLYSVTGHLKGCRVGDGGSCFLLLQKAGQEPLS